MGSYYENRSWEQFDVDWIHVAQHRNTLRAGMETDAIKFTEFLN